MEGYLSMPFEVVSEKHNFYIGVITDGYYKLNINYTKKDAKIEGNYFIGSKFKITGRVMSENKGKPIYVSVSDPSQVQFIDDAPPMDISSVLLGFNPIP